MRFSISMNPDRMKYQKNSLSYCLCLLALLLDILSLSTLLGYPPQLAPDLRTGADVITHIIFLMMCFMIAEKTKIYKKNWSYAAVAAGIYQALRIFIFVLPYRSQGLMTDKVYIANIIFALSGMLLLLGAGALCFARAVLLEKHEKVQA